MLWTCTSCGYLIEGRQPMYECPICEAYKTSFIDIPQHIEREIREANPKLPHNHQTCRTTRVERIKRDGLKSKRRAAGRVLPAVTGTNIDTTGNDF
jgi:rubredoxin